MTYSSMTKRELGLFVAVMDRFNKQRLPRLLKMKEKVDRGGTLDEQELALLKEAIAEAKAGEPFAEKHPSVKRIITQAQDLYSHITAKALENEKSADQ